VLLAFYFDFWFWFQAFACEDCEKRDKTGNLEKSLNIKIQRAFVFFEECCFAGSARF
jgi:hypothetical protein